MPHKVDVTAMKTTHWCVWLVLSGSACWAEASSPKTYRVETIAGSGDIGDTGPALAAELGSIQGVAVDTLGNLYLSDTDYHRIRKVTADGVISIFAGTGVAGFGGDGGPADRAQLNMPYGIAIGGAGDLYVADLGNNRVRHITPDGLITTVAGNGDRSSKGDGGPAVEASLCTPRNLALDTVGNLYISEFEGHRVRKVAPGGIISTFAGNGMAGFNGDGSLVPYAQFAFPAGLALDLYGALYIADSQNQRVRRIAPDGRITTVLGGVAGTKLQTPTAVAASHNGFLYVGDQSSTVRAYTIISTWINVAGTGAPWFAGDGGPAVSASLTSANDLAVDGGGNIYIADGKRIRRVDPDGVIQTVAGDGYWKAVGEDGRATSARLFRPTGVAFDRAGNLYVADSGTERVRMVLPSGSISPVTGTGLPGFAGDGATALGAPSHTPTGVAVDSAGALLIAETGSHRIRKLANGIISTVAGTGGGGSGAEGGPAAETPLRLPKAVCVGLAGALYIVDSGNHRVLTVTADGRIARVAGSGVAGYANDNAWAPAARLQTPSACAVDSGGNLLIADTLNHRIRRVTPGGIITTVAGTGLPGVSGDEGLATAARLNAPTGVAADASGSIFISDTGNHRIRQVTPDGVIHTLAGGDQAGFAGDGALARAALLDTPGGLQLDSSGNVYFADTNNNRVRRLTPEVVTPEVEPLPPPALIQVSVLNAASLLEGPVAPGEILTIFGAGIGPVQGANGTFDSTGLLTTEVGGTEVRFDNIRAPVLYAQQDQINLQVPYTVAGRAQTQMEIRYNGKAVAAAALAVTEAAPALFPVAANQDGSPNSPSEPAPRGTILTFYGTGEGLTDGPNIAGRMAELPYPRPLLPVTVAVAGLAAEILYAGSAPGLVGVFQLNARVPGGYIPPGTATVIVSVGGAAAPPFQIWLK